jgi:hypothetical protein
MVKLILGLAVLPSPHDAADALAVAICHVHSQLPAGIAPVPATRVRAATSWRHFRP